ncbi:helix-turn-helix domain-containing protein [Streptomyces sp. MNP-20]|uniref:helix-turn-helix domain-containing protein n=1 Tax=Streptomyces sp. MNP-20 TaxID=2721165 RepID=UPI0020A69D1E|nr:helix-turn-helix domain-containing protein [Streptomyces sp. MNP-20]
MRQHFQEGRLAAVKREAARLDALIATLPTQLADGRAMQHIADGLVQALDAHVLVSEPDRVLAASPPTAAESLARAVIRRSLQNAGSGGATGPHAQLFSLAPSSGTDTVLAAARPSPPFDDADIRLLGHAARFLGLLDQARREYGSAAAASEATRAAVLELLMSGEVAKARRVMATQAPGLLEAQTVRVYVLATAPARRGATARRCEAAVGSRALVVTDLDDDRRVLVIHPLRPGPGDATVADELTRVVASLGPDTSLGGSRTYAITLTADALREAGLAQRLAVHQPGSIALSAHRADPVTLLPQLAAQRWAHHLLHPLMCPARQWERTRETLNSALAYPYTVAARRLHLHRNTVARRVNRAAARLRMDFSTVSDRIAVGLALDLVSHHGVPDRTVTLSEPPPSLRCLLRTPQVTAWADALLAPARGDRRALLTTATSWLHHNLHVEPTARALGVTVVTVRSHLQALEAHMDRDLACLSGQRDLQYALHVLTGQPGITDVRTSAPS